MLAGGAIIMSRGIGRSFLSGPNVVAICLPRGSANCGSSKSKFNLCGLSQSRRLAILSISLTAVLEASSIRRRSSSRAARSYASFARSGGQKTSWDEAADSYFSEERVAETPPSKSETDERKWKSPANRERQDSRINSDAFDGDGNGRANRSRNSESAYAERKDVERRSRYGADVNLDAGVRKWKSPANRERQNFRSNSDAYDGDGHGRANRSRNPESADTERKDRERSSRYGAERNRTDQWQRSAAKGYRSRDDGAYSGRSGSDWQTRGKKLDGSWGNDHNIARDDRAGFGDDRRWQTREYSPPLPVEGQALYGVAPIISALQISRRTFYTLYMQENLLLNIGIGRRKDKAAVTAIEKMARRMGLAIKEASKHDLNMLVDNRPHQGLILDASPLELTPVDTLDPPVYQDNKPPVWVALDEVTDPQNFGAILRSAYFLGAEGVVVCAKNSAPLSGVVSKASAGAMEVMEVLFCKNMVRFLDGCKENGWRVVGASAESASVSVRQLPHGIATILVVGSEGKGLRTNVKRSCDRLVSIAGVSTSNQRPKYDFVAQDFEESELDLDEDEESGRRGAESGLISGPSAVDSLNVSVATGILLHELLDSPTETDALLNN